MRFEVFSTIWCNDAWLSWTMTVPESLAVYTVSNDDHLRDCEQVTTRFHFGNFHWELGAWWLNLEADLGALVVIQKGGVKGLNSRSQCQEAEEEKGLKELLETHLVIGLVGEGERRVRDKFWVLGLDNWLGGDAADYIRKLRNKNRFREKGWSVWSHTCWVWGFCKRWHLWSGEMFRSEDRVSSQ